MEQITVDQQARVRLSTLTDRGGKPAQIDGVPVWASSNDAVMSVTSDAADPFLVLCVPADDAADQLVNVTATVDADLGDGFEPHVGVMNWAIAGGKVVFVGLTVEAVEPKPAA